MFERILWQSGRALLRSRRTKPWWRFPLRENLVFRLERDKNDQWDLGDQCFAFHKDKELIEEYERAFSRRPGLRPRHILEIGMWDGGSLAFWNEILHPEKIVGVDLNVREDSAYFRDYVQTRGLQSKVRWFSRTTSGPRLCWCRPEKLPTESFTRLTPWPKTM